MSATWCPTHAGSAVPLTAVPDLPLDAILATWGLGIVVGQLITLGFGRDVPRLRPEGRRQWIAHPPRSAAQLGRQ